MKTKRDYRDFLQDIVENAQKAISFVEKVNFQDFKKNEEKIFAVIRALELIGEAAKNIPKSVRSINPEIPWDEMCGMRNKLVHEYFGIDVKVVWKTVRQDLPPLIEAVTALMRNLSPMSKRK
jgi:uncharacterized protein with HEPN domain